MMSDRLEERRRNVASGLKQIKPVLPWGMRLRFWIDLRSCETNDELDVLILRLSPWCEWYHENHTAINRPAINRLKLGKVG